MNLDKKTTTTLLLILVFILSNSCLDTPTKLKKQPIKVILDTDMGSDCDDVGALALLHAYADLEKAEILACIYSSGKIPFGAGIIDAINTYYGRKNIPVGAYQKNDFGDPVDKMNAEKLAKDTIQYHHKIIYNTDAIEQTILNRKVLAAQKDHSVVYITIGHTKGLYELLNSKADTISSLNGFDLLRKKVSKWVALGALRANSENYSKDWNFFSNETAIYTKYLIEHFPSPIHFINAGSNVMTGKSLMNTTNGNIIKDTYKNWLWKVEKKTLIDQRHSWDLAAVYYAINGEGKYFDPKKAGELEFDIIKGYQWRNDEKKSNQFYIHQKENTNYEFANHLNKMIAKTPKANLN